MSQEIYDTLRTVWEKLEAERRRKADEERERSFQEAWRQRLANSAEIARQTVQASREMYERVYGRRVTR